MAYSIMLDAGHGGQDPGAVYKGRQEKNDNLKLALAVGEILKNKGIDISYTRTGDVYQTPFEKAQLANQAGLNIRWLRIFWELWEKWDSAKSV